MKILRNEKGFSLVELLAVLVILALLAILAGGTVMNVINKAESQVTATQERAILSAAEKWSVDNSEKFDDVEGTKVQVGLDIVFVVDVSGSMDFSLVSGLSNGCYSTSCKNNINYTTTRYYAAVDAINGALEVLKNNPKSRISFVFYSGGITKTFSLTSASSVGDLSVTKSHYINVMGTSVYINGGTYTQGGFVKASEILVNASNKENQIPVIILLTDGEPTYGHGDYTGSGNNKNLNYNTSRYSGKPTTYQSYISANNSTGSSFSSPIGWHLINNASLATAAIKSSYNVEPFIYTIGLGLEEDYNKFVLDPSEENFNDLKNGSTTGKNLYTAIDDKLYINGEYQTQYDYVTKSFVGKMDTSDLNQYFREIAEQVTDAAEVTQVCVTVKDLYDGGYLSTDDIELADGEAASTYVIMNFNEATNQYNFSLAKTAEQEEDCKKLLNASA